MDTPKTVYFFEGAKPYKSTKLQMRNAIYAEGGSGKERMKENIDTPESVFRYCTGKTAIYMDLRVPRSKKSSKFPKKLSKNPLHFC